MEQKACLYIQACVHIKSVNSEIEKKHPPSSTRLPIWSTSQPSPSCKIEREKEKKREEQTHVNLPPSCRCSLS